LIVVSDSSPLVALAGIGRLELLRALYGTVVVPDAVWHEVVEKAPDQNRANALRTADWLERRIPTDQPLVLALQESLGRGEAEAVALAVEVKSDLLLMDERIGRRLARQLGVRVIGVLGMLVEAKQRSLVPAIKPMIDQLRDAVGFRLGAALVERVLADEGET